MFHSRDDRDEFTWFDKLNKDNSNNKYKPRLQTNTHRQYSKA